MRHFRKLIMAVTVVMAVVTVGCSDLDAGLGSNFLPDSNATKVGELYFDSGVSSSGEGIVSTRLFRSDRITTTSQSYAAIGLEHDEVFGLRRTGFFSQYTPSNLFEDDDDKFGYGAFMDSMLVYISVASYSGDTTYVCTYEVYEVVDDSFLTNSADSLYSLDFDFMNSGALGSEPLFEFTFPDQANKTYVSSSYVMAQNVTESGYALGERMLLYDDIDEDIYEGDYEEFVENFKGVYIIPKETTIGVGEGATYAIQVSSSGIGFYGRSVYEDDPTIVADTIGMAYSFRDSSVEDVGGVSVQTVLRDYSTAAFDYSLVKSDDNPTVSVTNQMRIEGLGGVLSEISFEPAFFEELEQIIESDEDGYENIFFNRAYMRIYTNLVGADGLDQSSSSGSLTSDQIDEMNTYPLRLGFYDTYSTYDDEYGYYELDGIEDYNYYYELYYGYSLDFGGYLNRTLGCYQMYMPLKMQDIWNDYREAKAAAGGDASAIDWESADWNKVYVAPTADSLFTPLYLTLQGGAGSDNVEGLATDVPIAMELTYTLVK